MAISLSALSSILWKDNRRLVGEAARILRKGGAIFLSVPLLNRYREQRIQNGRYRTSTTKLLSEDRYTPKNTWRRFSVAWGCEREDLNQKERRVARMARLPGRPRHLRSLSARDQI